MSLQNIFELIQQEQERQLKQISLIASENIVYPEVLKALSTCLTNKYAEGKVGQRFYGGCKYIDEIESQAIELSKELFGSNYANVQAYSGSIANFAILSTLLSPGETILSMDMASGGHLSHSSPHSFVSMYKVITYTVNEYIDFEQIERLVLLHKPKVIICGSSSYPYKINFQLFKEKADLVGAYLFADISHLSGLIVAGLHTNPFPFADVVMTTTHKQLRGPRGAIILWNNPNLLFDKKLFPGIQGGPQCNTIAGIAIALTKAKSKEFTLYMKEVIKHSKELSGHIFKLCGISPPPLSTDSHMFLLNTVTLYNLRGDVAQKKLELADIIVNKNQIPNDPFSFISPSGIRIGTLSTPIKGLNSHDILNLAQLIHKTLSSH